MIITCPNCSTSYKIPDGSIGANGRNVKCAKCGHKWLAGVENQEQSNIPNISSTNRPFTSDTKLPTVIEQEFSVGAKIFVACLYLLLLCGSFIFSQYFILDHFPESKKLYNSLSLYDTRKLALADVSIDQLSTNEKSSMDIIISSQITNTGKADSIVPIVRVNIYDKNNDIISTYLINNEQNAMIKSGSSYNISTKLDNVPINSELLTMDIGNALELYLR